MKRVFWIAAVVTVAAAVVGISLYYLGGQITPRQGFLVEDTAGDQMSIDVDPSRQQALDSFLDMSQTGESMWVGGEIESFDNQFGFRFVPDTIVVAEITAEGSQAGTYSAIQADFAYWQAYGVVYIFGTVVDVPL